jgi:hypothetical protein
MDPYDPQDQAEMITREDEEDRAREELEFRRHEPTESFGPSAEQPDEFLEDD